MSKISQRTAMVGLVAGIVAVPALVMASTALLSGGDDLDEQVRTAVSAQTARAAVTDVVLEPVPAAESSAENGTDDLDAACGPEGMALIERERAGEITAIEKAALDALRPICTEVGLALPEQLVPQPVVIVETVVNEVPAAPEHEDNDEYEDHDHEDEEHDEEHEEEDDEEEDDEDDDEEDDDEEEA